MKVWGLLAAAGAGMRLMAGDGVPKAFRPVGGVPMYLHAIGAFERAGVTGVAVVVPVNWLEHALATMVEQETKLVVELRPGANTRGASVRAGLAAIPDDTDAIVVHDAARPLVGPALITDALAALAHADAAVCAVPMADTVKRVDGDRVAGTLPRDELRRAQTPQAFRAAVLREAHARALADGIDASDDAALVERIGGTVVVVPGDERNIKVTTAVDLTIVEALMRAGEER